jgi:protein-L-isoaspartate(D-aspartate) O-methyltransferase
VEIYHSCAFAGIPDREGTMFIADREAPSALAAAARRYTSTRPDVWEPVPEDLDREIAHDRRLASAAQRAREALVWNVAQRFGPFDRRYLDALFYVPRERFVLPEDIELSAEDVPVPLDTHGNATVSAPHAYLLTFRLLGLEEGDHLLELGTGTGYGSALARYIVGPVGHVTTVEIDPILHARAARLLGADRYGEAEGVTLLKGDGRALASEILSERTRPTKIAVTYAMTDPPGEIERLLPEGGCLVAPVGPTDGQALMRSERRGGVLSRAAHGAVRYVLERRPIEA